VNGLGGTRNGLVVSSRVDAADTGPVMHDGQLVGITVCVVVAIAVLRFARTPRQDRRSRTLRIADLILILGGMSLLASIEGWLHLPDWMRQCLVGVAAVALVTATLIAISGRRV